MHAERVDGYNPLAVADAIAAQEGDPAGGPGPVLLDTVTYRFSGHSPSDAIGLPHQGGAGALAHSDSLVGLSRRTSWRTATRATTTGGLSADGDRGTAGQGARGRDLAGDLAPHRRCRAWTHRRADVLQPARERMADGEPEVLLPKEESRLATTHAKVRFGLDEDGKPLPKLRTLTYAEALFEAMMHRFYDDPTMVAYGEENRDWGGAFAVYRGLTEALPYHRLFNSPISEGAIVGTAVGYALERRPGRGRADVLRLHGPGRRRDLQPDGQMAVHVGRRAARCRWCCGSRWAPSTAPSTPRTGPPWSPTFPGSRSMFPATPYDAKGMLNLALRGTDPVVFFESQRLYAEPETLVGGRRARSSYYEVPRASRPCAAPAGPDHRHRSARRSTARWRRPRCWRSKYGVSPPR